jgi:hypothetical protein
VCSNPYGNIFLGSSVVRVKCQYCFYGILCECRVYVKHIVGIQH